MSFLAILLIFGVWRIFDFAILYFAPKFIPYLGFFPYVQELKKFHLPQWIYSLANFDGVHYLKIAQHGYEQYEQAFFPLYPLLIKLVNFITHNALVSGLAISNLAFLFGLWTFVKYMNMNKVGPSFWVILMFLVFPASFFFGAVYTEGLFFFFIISSLYFIQRKKYISASLFAFFSSLTRFMGLFLIIPILFHFVKRSQKKILNLKSLILFVSPILGFLLYSFYLLKTTGDPLFFLNSQPIFGAHRSTHFVLLPQVYIRYFKIFFTAGHDFRYFVSLFEFIIFTFVFVILILDLLNHLKLNKNFKLKIKNFDGVGLNFFSIINLLLPTFTGTLSSIPRYALISVSFFIFLGPIQNKLIKILLGILFFISHIIILGFFGRGYFVG